MSPPEKNKTMTTELQSVDGMQLYRGYLSPYLVTDAERTKWLLRKPYLLIHDKNQQHEGPAAVLERSSVRVRRYW